MKKIRFLTVLLLCVCLAVSPVLADSNHLHFSGSSTGQHQGLAAELTRTFMSVAAAGAGESYCLWVSGDLDVRVTDEETGEYISSQPGERKSGASFGYLTTLGDSLEQKLILFVGDGKTICFHGTADGPGSYQLVKMNGLTASEEVMAEKDQIVSVMTYERIRLQGGRAVTEQIDYNPLEIGSLDPFSGISTRGSEYTVSGTLLKDAKVLGCPDLQSFPLATLKAKSAVDVLARYDGWLLVARMGEHSRLARGWVQETLVTCSGQVPDLCPLEGVFTLREAIQSRQAPSERAEASVDLEAGTEVELVYAERDFTDREWATVRTSSKGKDLQVCVPADVLDGWTEKTVSGFRIGYRSPQYQWQHLLGGNGYTEWMCVQPQNSLNGVILSGRTSSKKSAFPAATNSRDALLMKMDPEGEPTGGRTFGGSDVDSFHWVHPGSGGYFVSGITRSTDRDFQEIWSPASHRNAAANKLKSSLALLGRVSEDLEIEWMQSFGTGGSGQSFGFDMVIELADGNIAGCGWMYGSDSSALPGHGKQDFYVVKTTPDGQLMDMVSLGSGVMDVPDSAVATPDGGLIMVGSVYNGDRADGLIMILNSSLDVVRTITYGGAGEDTFDNIRALPDGTFIVTGFTDSVSGNGVSASHGGFDFWVMNIDDQGRAIWNRRFGGSGNEELCGTLVLRDGSCILLGSTESFDGDVKRGMASGKKKDAWAVCVSDTGRLLWQFAGGTDGPDAFNAAAVDPADNGVVMAGLAQNRDDKNAVGYAVKALIPEAEQDNPDDYVSTVSLFDPVDVALIIDVSGSMADSNPSTGKTLLSYAQDAAISFSRTLFALSPESRISVIAYDNTASLVAGLSGAENRLQLYSCIRSMMWGGSTNTGDGFRLADETLTAGGIPGRGQLTLMLTDGLANEGIGNPQEYAVSMGTALARHSLVYTVGMLGNMSSSDIGYVRSTLNAGYETRYFEVTFSDLEE